MKSCWGAVQHFKYNSSLSQCMETLFNNHHHLPSHHQHQQQFCDLLCFVLLRIHTYMQMCIHPVLIDYRWFVILLWTDRQTGWGTPDNFLYGECFWGIQSKCYKSINLPLNNVTNVTVVFVLYHLLVQHKMDSISVGSD